ncbi:BON domain-containing protein [Pelagerythrobacter rhizovicinus]|uniref:BON domain-containing protein n=2 Tax=Pelagerythrobacter rhizovicinus TaxID=2268576 RepID=A0A4Q2KL21_9SPHN|nr:BON domain-containing protein [Pelagerythrobacter rhizovicinus]
MGERRGYREDYRDRGQARTEHGGWREREDRGAAQSRYRSSFGPARFDTGEGRGFTSFTGSDQPGRDFAAGDRRPYGGYGAGFGGMSAAYGSGMYDVEPHRGQTDRYEDRGFLERAGDEVASWFGDQDAARRRRMDHRGRGPANYTRSDQRILEDVCDALTDDWDLDASGIQVSVENGEVTLDGTVDSRFDKRRAEDCAEDVSGVGHVQNNLRVNARSYRNESAGRTLDEDSGT